MSKAQEQRRRAGSIMAESMGAGVRVDPPVTSIPPPAGGARLQGLIRENNVARIPVDKIVPDPSQPRQEFEPESLARLAQSMKTKGQLQPVQVKWDEPQGHYVLIAGERRWRAAKLAGLPTVTAVIHEGELTRGQVKALQLVENCLRDDLRPIEQAHAFRDLMDENGWTTRQLAEELSVAQPTISHAVALLKLPEPLQEQVEQGVLAPAAGYELSKLDNPQEQAALAEQAVAGGLRRDDLREEVQQRINQKTGGGKSSKPTVKIVRGNLEIIVKGPESEAEAFAARIRRLR